MERLKILHEQVLEQQNSFRRVKRYIRGWHPEIKNAVLIKGITGKETYFEGTVIEPIGVFYIDKKK